MSGPRKRVREDPKVRRSQIVDEAIRIIGEYGYYGFTVQALAERCQLSNAGLLHYFGNKDDLLLALLDEIERREEEVLAPQVAMIEEKGFQSGNGKGAALEMMAAIARRTAENRERTRFLAVLQGEAMEPSHPAHDWFGLRDDETVQLFTSLLGREAANSPALTRYMISILRGMTGLWLRDENEFDLVEECLAATRLLLNDA